jgi:hypothetical protein
METATVVVADIRDEKGGPIPCKVQFKGTNGTLSPNWGPPTAREAVVNLFYSATGRFTIPINPGRYEAIISYGPEYDVVRLPVTVARGARVPLSTRLKRAFATPGWVSADFHSHSSPSGDNTSDQRGRGLNLLCEHIQFAPCTEHNRIDSYTPHLRALGVEQLMGTCPGIELTGTPLPLNHQNAFPLVFKPRTQDGGAPLTDFDPPTQIRRLADWDNRSEKLVQQNHPDIGWLFFDRNGDGMPDNGFQAGFPFMQVIEVHPIHEILELEPTRLHTETTGRKVVQNHTIFNWLQLLNHGYRIPGVVNTDAHYNFHGSGGLRNYVRCDASVPGDIDPLDIVRHARQGHIVMSTGPFLDVHLDGALPGDDLKPKNGKATLAVRVFCPNWFDIDRVQVLINGRPEPGLNFTRRSHPALFRDQAERFAHQVELTFARDAHVIVVAIGEESELGEVMGPLWGRQRPTAISNPIFVDPDANGFEANRDSLGHPLPVKGGQSGAVRGESAPGAARLGCGCPSPGLSSLAGAAEADVGSGAFGFALAPSGRHVAATVLVAAQKRPAALDLLRPNLRLQRIEAVLPARPDRVGGGTVQVITRMVPVGAPFPDIAGHIVQSESIGGEGADRSGADEAVGRGVLVGEVPLPDVALPAPAAGAVVTPDERLAVESTAGGVFPFRLGRQALAGPAGVGVGIFPGDVHHGVVLPPLDGAAGPLGMAPASAGYEQTPFVKPRGWNAVEKDRLRGRQENQ